MWRARWAGSPVAVKVLHGADQHAQWCESRLMALAKHPNVLQVFGVASMPPGESLGTGQTVVVMELEGVSLSTWLGRNRPRRLRQSAATTPTTSALTPTTLTTTPVVSAVGQLLGSAPEGGASSAPSESVSASPASTPGKTVLVVSRRELHAFWRQLVDLLCQLGMTTPTRGHTCTHRHTDAILGCFSLTVAVCVECSLVSLIVSVCAASALAHCHAVTPHPIIHCDVKPGNVLVQRMAGTNRAKLADFGAAVVADTLAVDAEQRACWVHAPAPGASIRGTPRWAPL